MLIKSKLNYLMITSIIFGFVAATALTYAGLNRGTHSDSNAIQLEYIFASLAILVVSAFLAFELFNNPQNANTNWTKKARFINRLIHGLLILLSLAAISGEGLSPIGAIIYPPILMASWIIVGLALTAIKKFKLERYFSTPYNKVASTYRKSPVEKSRKNATTYYRNASMLRKIVIILVIILLLFLIL